MKLLLRKDVRRKLIIYPMNPVYKSVTPAIICAFLGGSYSVGIQNSRKQKAKEGIMKSKAAKYLFDIP